MALAQLIKNATLVNEGEKRKADVLIEDERIADIFFDGVPDDVCGRAKVIDATGKYLFPGVIDDQVHFREPGLTQKADMASESAAAVAGGVTSFMDMPNTIPQTTSLTLLQEKYDRAAQTSVANYAFYLGATKDNIREIVQVNQSMACGVKLFMGSSTGGMLVDDPESLSRIFAEVPCLMAVHCEDEATIRQNLAHYRAAYGENIPMRCHSLIRNAEACYRSSALAVQLAEKYGTRLHLLHLSTAREMQLLNNSSDLSKKQITSEVCVHHLWFNDDSYATKGALIKWNPAIKTEQDRQALCQALLENRIDVIGSDHAPHTWEEKHQSAYVSTPSGGPLVQHTLNVMLELYHRGVFSLEQIVQKMCHAPADLFGVEQRGYIRKGYWADLVLVDLEAEYTVDKSNLWYKCQWSPFEQQCFHSKVLSTWVNGCLVFDNQTVLRTQIGKPLSFRKRQ